MYRSILCPASMGDESAVSRQSARIESRRIKENLMVCDFKLNEKKALKKKYNQTKRLEDVRLWHTGGGEFSTAVFEAIKQQALDYYNHYSVVNPTYCVTIKEKVDQKRNVTEYIISVKSNDVNEYTLNLYNTNDSFLANGTFSGQLLFLNTDFKQIRHHIQKLGINFDEANEEIRTAI